jgi:hypothetical protein
VGCFLFHSFPSFSSSLFFLFFSLSGPCLDNVDRIYTMQFFHFIYSMHYGISYSSNIYT